MPSPFLATRYHSLIVCENTLPASLQITARTSDGLPMALRHTEWPLYGVQFHPESILTDHGHRLLTNFLRLAGISALIPDNELPRERSLVTECLPERESVEQAWTTDTPLHW